MTDFMHDIHGWQLQSFNKNQLIPDILRLYTNIIHDKGDPLDNCFGFVARVEISKPMRNQRIMGTKESMPLNFKILFSQMVLFQVYRVHMKAESMECYVNRGSWQHSNAQYGQMNICLVSMAIWPTQQVCIYGGRFQTLMVLIKEILIKRWVVRIEVEWLFGDIKTFFQICRF